MVKYIQGATSRSTVTSTTPRSTVIVTSATVPKVAVMSTVPSDTVSCISRDTVAGETEMETAGKQDDGDHGVCKKKQNIGFDARYSNGRFQ